jgi:hypothetical protein
MLSRFGRIALLANLGLSLMFAFWAFALWYNRIDFETEKKNRDEIIKRFSSSIQPGMSRLAATGVSLQTVEKKRYHLLVEWYPQQLEELRNGNSPIQAVVFQKGELQYDLQGHPLLGPILDAAGQKIEVQGSLNVLDQKYKALDADLNKTRSEYDATNKETKKVTDAIGNGSAAPGLRWQLWFWQDAERRSLTEQEFVKPLLYNRLVELDILKNRQVALNARLRELEGAAVTRK